MLKNQLLKDHFGQHYKILTQREHSAAVALEPEHFHSSSQALNTIRSLETTPSYWKNIVNSATLQRSTSTNETQLQTEAAILLYRGKLKLYKISPAALTSNPEKNTLQDNGENKFTFLPVSSLLVNAPEDVKTFSSKENAAQFLLDLNPDIEQLRELSSELGINEASENSTSKAYFISIIGLALASGDIIIAVKKPAAPQTPEEVIEDTTGDEAGNRNAANDTPITTGSQSKTNNENKKENKAIEHTCLFKKMTLKCQHKGREATLDPANAIDKKTQMAVAPFLAITSSPVNSPSKDIEKLTAKIDIDDICDNHKTKPAIITGNDIRIIGEPFGKTIQFESPCENINIARRFYRYIWPPSVKPISYTVSPPNACKMEDLKGKAKSIRVNVYPKLSWDVNVDIGFGQIKTSDSSATEGVIERKIEEEQFSISGKASCTYGNNKPIEFASKFNNKFNDIKSEIDGQNALLSQVFGKFQEGDNHSVTLDLPVLNFTGTSSIAEKAESHLVETKWDYTIKAAPLIGITAEVDVLPMLIKASGWGSMFLPLLKELKEKYANPDGSIGVQLEASVILSVAGKVEFDLKFTDETFVNDERETLRSLKFNVPFECKGELKGKGHLLLFSAELGVIAKVNTGFAYEMFMGADADGIYRSSTLHFHGIVFEIKAYVKGERKAAGTNSGRNARYASSKQLDFNNKWTWIEKSEFNFDKKYLISDA